VHVNMVKTAVRWSRKTLRGPRVLLEAKDMENNNNSETSSSKKDYIVISKGNVYKGSRLKKIQMPVYSSIP